MRKVDFNVKFKPELSNIELFGIEKMLERLDSDEYLPNDSKSYGLAYTSHDGIGKYNVTEIINFNDLEIGYFGITENNMLIMVCWDSNEDEQMFEIENSDLY